MTIQKKLFTSFIVMAIIIILIGIINYMSVNRMNKEYTHLIEERMEKKIMLEQLAKDHSVISNHIRGYFLFKDLNYLKDRSRLNEKIEKDVAILEKSLQKEENQKRLKEIKESIQAYLELTTLAISDFHNGQTESAFALIKEAALHQQEIERQVGVMIEFQNGQVKKAQKDLTQLVQTVRITVLILVIIGIVGSILISLFVPRSISKPIQLMTETLNELDQGNFAVDRLDIKNRDELGTMANALNRMVEDLKKMLLDARDASIEIATQAEELSASSEENLAASEMVTSIAEKNMQASELQMTIAHDSYEAMLQMGDYVNRITEDNEEMLRSTTAVSDYVSEGAAFMGDVSKQMVSISEQIKQTTATVAELANYSENIREVTEMITSIADQTNLLALNAAIEAARAGEHGQGFAVVADEVRNLAEQSRRSAEEIDRMIETVIDNVQVAVHTSVEGNQLVEVGLEKTTQTAVVFDKIEEATTDVKDKVGMVSDDIHHIRVIMEEIQIQTKEAEELAHQVASEAQSTSAATEEQLASNEQISSSAQTLTTVADKLQKNISNFQV